MPDVDRGVVRLVVDEKQRLADRGSTALRILCSEPLDQVSQRVRVLLDHEDHGLLEVLQGDPDAVRDCLVEIALGRGERVGPPPGIEAPDAHQALTGQLSLPPAGAVETDETLVDSALGLIAQVVVNTGNDDDSPCSRRPRPCMPRPCSWPSCRDWTWPITMPRRSHSPSLAGFSKSPSIRSVTLSRLARTRLENSLVTRSCLYRFQ